MIYYSDRLVWAMEKAGTSIRELAEVLGTSYQAVKKVIDGRSAAFNSANNARAAQYLNVSSDWLAIGLGPFERAPSKSQLIHSEALADGYVRLEHLCHPLESKRPGTSRSKVVLPHLDMQSQFLKEQFGIQALESIKLFTAVGRSMEPAIYDQDVVVIDTAQTWIDAPGYYLIEVADVFILKKALIQANRVLKLKSENSASFPDEELYQLEDSDKDIRIQGKVIAWWTLNKG